MQLWGTALNCTEKGECVRVRKSSVVVVVKKYILSITMSFSDVLNQ